MSESAWRSSPSRPCPVCGKRDQSCLIRSDAGSVFMVLCRGVSGPHSHLLAGRWEWIKAIADGPGGGHVRPIVEEVTYTPKAKRQKQAAEPIAQDSEGLGVVEQVDQIRASAARRHQGYSALLDGLPALDPETRDYLFRNRLLTPAQIDLLERRIGLRQIRRDQILKQAAGLPGFDDQGRYKGPSGILVPSIVRDVDGSQCIAGFQIATAPEELVAGVAKYKAVSLGASVEEARDGHYQKVAPVDENGVQFVEGGALYSCVLAESPSESILVDSSLKTYITAVRQGAAAFGAPGLQFFTRYRQLKAGLVDTVGLNGSVLIALDSGDGENATILATAFGLYAQLERDGFKVRFCLPKGSAFREKQAKADIDDAPERRVTQQKKTAREVEKLLAPSIRNQAKAGAQSVLKRGIRAMTLEDSLELPLLDDEEVERFPAGQRTETIKAKFDEGFRTVLVKDGTGLGKSHWAASLYESGGAKLLGASQVLILTNSPYETAQHFQEQGINVAVLRGRNHGIKELASGIRAVMRSPDDLGEGETLKDDENCTQLDKLARYQARQLGPLISGLCRSCKDLEHCTVGDGYFLSDRQIALAHDVVIMHPASLVETFLIDHTDDDGACTALAICDDLTEESFLRDRTVSLKQVQKYRAFFTRSRSISLNTLLHWIEELLLNNAELQSDELRRVFEARFHLENITRNLSWPTLLELELELVHRAPDADGLVCWLELLAAWIAGNSSAWVDAGGLHFRSLNAPLLNTLRRCMGVVALDATGSATVWERLLGTRPAVIQTDLAQVGAEVRVTQITGIGRLGFSRSSQERFRLAVALKVLADSGRIEKASTAICEVKSGQEAAAPYADTMLTWLGSSRGSNAAKACKSLVLVGAPNTNLGAAAASFELLFGRSVDVRSSVTAVYPVMASNTDQQMVAESKGAADPGFRRWYRHKLTAAYEQGYGRMRASIRTDEEGLEVFVLTDAPTPFLVELLPFSDLIGEKLAAELQRLNNRTLKASAMSLAEAGIKPTAQALAAHLKVSQWLVELWLSGLGYRPNWLASAHAKAKGQAAKAAKETETKAKDCAEPSTTDGDSTSSESCVESAENTATFVDTGLAASA